MEIVSQLADIFAKTGGFGLAAVFAWMYWKKDRELSDLQKELRNELKETTKALVSATTEQNILSAQVVKGLDTVSDDLRRNAGNTH